MLTIEQRRVDFEERLREDMLQEGANERADRR